MACVWLGARIKMKFELDEYYFNRAGDKVKYVGRNDIFGDGYLFRLSNGDTYYTKENGTIRYNDDSSYDILGKWKINDDPNRVYVIDGIEYIWVAKGCPQVWNESKGLRLFSEVQKILIKPSSGSVSSITISGKPKKIEFLTNGILDCTLNEYKDKINEIIDVLNEGRG